VRRTSNLFAIAHRASSAGSRAVWTPLLSPLWRSLRTRLSVALLPSSADGTVSSRRTKPPSPEFEIPEATCEEAGWPRSITRNSALQPQPLRFYNASSSEIFGNGVGDSPTRARRCAYKPVWMPPKLSRHNWRQVYRDRTPLCLQWHSLQSRIARRGENFVTRKIGHGCADRTESGDGAGARILRAKEIGVVPKDMSRRCG